MIFSVSLFRLFVCFAKVFYFCLFLVFFLILSVLVEVFRFLHFVLLFFIILSFSVNSSFVFCLNPSNILYVSLFSHHFACFDEFSRSFIFVCHLIVLFDQFVSSFCLYSDFLRCSVSVFFQPFVCLGK